MALAHHLDEEERTILNPARDADDETRERLGRAFREERQRQLDADCGDIENVRRLVEQSTHVEH